MWIWQLLVDVMYWCFCLYLSDYRFTSLWIVARIGTAFFLDPHKCNLCNIDLNETVPHFFTKGWFRLNIGLAGRVSSQIYCLSAAAPSCRDYLILFLPRDYTFSWGQNWVRSPQWSISLWYPCTYLPLSHMLPTPSFSFSKLLNFFCHFTSNISFYFYRSPFPLTLLFPSIAQFAVCWVVLMGIDLHSSPSVLPGFAPGLEIRLWPTSSFLMVYKKLKVECGLGPCFLYFWRKF